ncbi:unnamed protein product, partial [Closterium sp. NIES-53]
PSPFLLPLLPLPQLYSLLFLLHFPSPIPIPIPSSPPLPPLPHLSSQNPSHHTNPFSRSSQIRCCFL